MHKNKPTNSTMRFVLQINKQLPQMTLFPCCVNLLFDVFEHISQLLESSSVQRGLVRMRAGAWQAQRPASQTSCSS